MPHIVTARCVDCRYMDCCEECPVDCFYTLDDPAMLAIDPETCIDCAICIPACPVHAIYPEAEVPAPYQDWIDKNRRLVPAGTQVFAEDIQMGNKTPAPNPHTLEQVQAHEQSQGLTILEPSEIT